jgi:TrmH family RNA methyltransferase
MISKASIKFIKSLQIKKYRKQEQCFTVEGAKSVLELVNSEFEIRTIYGTADFVNQLPKGRPVETVTVTAAELSTMGAFQMNESALAVAVIKENKRLDVSKNEFGLVLDDIRDPGNLGTIIRTADWYGIKNIIASEETADIYNAKVITASMGSFTRTSIYYTNLVDYLSGTPHRVLGAFLGGTDVHHFTFGSGGLIVIGNEGKGISPAVEKLITHRITIPRYGQAESLNAAIATAIICDNLRRQP